MSDSIKSPYCRRPAKHEMQGAGLHLEERGKGSLKRYALDDEINLEGGERSVNKQRPRDVANAAIKAHDPDELRALDGRRCDHVMIQKNQYHHQEATPGRILRHFDIADHPEISSIGYATCQGVTTSTHCTLSVLFT